MRPIPFSQFRDELLRLYDPPHRAPSTRRQMHNVLKHLDTLGCKTTADLTPVLVARFVEARPPGQSPRTLQTVLRVFRGICNQAAAAGYLEVSPFARRRVSQWVGRIGPPADKRHFTRDEIQRVLAQAAMEVETLRGWPGYKARRLQAVVNIAAYCGLRKGELLHLHADDVLLESRCILILDRGRTGGHSLKTAASAQPVPIPAALVPILESWLSHRLDAPPGMNLPESAPTWLIPNLRRTGPWTGGCMGDKPVDRVKALALRAGVEGLTLQALRRSLATHLEGHSVGQAMITRILRHSVESTTRRWYQQADVRNMAAAVEGFSYA